MKAIDPHFGEVTILQIIGSLAEIKVEGHRWTYFTLFKLLKLLEREQGKRIPSCTSPIPRQSQTPQ